MTIAQFPAFARQHWEKIRLRLMAGTYHPAPVRRVFIPKPNGEVRPKNPGGRRGDLHPQARRRFASQKPL